MPNPINNMPQAGNYQPAPMNQQNQQGLQMSPSEQLMLAKQLMGQQNQQKQARSPLEALGNTLMDFQRQQQLEKLANQGNMNGGNGLLNCSRSIKVNKRPIVWE